MTKRFLTIIFVLTAFVFSANAQLRVFIDDNDGPFTNIRNAPKGKVVSKVSATSGIMLTVLYQKNGWWYNRYGLLRRLNHRLLDSQFRAGGWHT